MPEIGRIQSTNFQSLLTELGITRNNIPFALRSEVTPVVLVGGTVSFIAAPTPAYRVVDVFSAGLLTAPGAGTVMADTGPLPIGAYSLEIWMQAQTFNTFDLQWRNALNTANLVIHRFPVIASENEFVSIRFDVQNDNERFRLVLTIAGGVGEDFQGTIAART